MEVPECPPTPPLLTAEMSSPKHAPSSPLQDDLNSQRSGSPEPNCPICLGPLDNKSYSDSCFHKFCFKCLLEWSKVKAECPLCKQKFKSIIHNVKSMDEYEQYTVQPAVAERERLLMMVDPWSVPPWFMRRAIRRHVNLPSTVQRPTPVFRLLDILPPAAHSRSEFQRRTRSSSSGSQPLTGLDQRRHIYRSNLWAQPLADVTGRVREASLIFFRNNPATTHRLLPWISRDLSALCDRAIIAVALERINGLVMRHDMRSREFSQEIREFLGEHTRHFMHELICFARSPYDMMGYDRNVRHAAWYPGLDDYGPIEAENDSSSEDDIMEVPLSPMSPVGILASVPLTSAPQTIDISQPDVFRSSPRSPSPEPGPSGMSTFNIHSPLLIESSDDDTIMNTLDTANDYSSDVEVVAILKPKHERTPVVVTLSDSDNEPTTGDSGAPWDEPETNYLDVAGPSTSSQVPEIVNVSSERKLDAIPSTSMQNSDYSSAVQNVAAFEKVCDGTASGTVKQKHKKSHKKRRRIVSSDDEWYEKAVKHKKKKSCHCKDSSSDERKSKSRKHNSSFLRSNVDIQPNYKDDWSSSDESSADKEQQKEQQHSHKSSKYHRDNWRVHMMSDSSSGDEGPSYPQIRSIVIRRQPQAHDSASSSSYSHSYRQRSDSDSSWEPRLKSHKKGSKSKDKGKGKGKGKKKSDK